MHMPMKLQYSSNCSSGWPLVMIQYDLRAAGHLCLPIRLLLCILQCDSQQHCSSQLRYVERENKVRLG